MNEIVYNDYSLHSFNTYGIGGKAKRIVIPNSVESLINLLNDLEKRQEKYFILGNGSNVILPDEDFEGTVIITKGLKSITIVNGILSVEAGVMLPYLNQYLTQQDYHIFLWASGIPGTIGGSVFGNAGAYGHDMMENLISIMVYQDGSIKELVKEDIEFSYRQTNIKGTVLSAKFRLCDIGKEELEILNEKIRKRFITQPLEYKNAGSVFRNPAPNIYAGQLIDELGLKGFRIGGASVSQKHGNFIINDAGATSKDIKGLIEIIKSKVQDKYNIDLILEQKIVKWN